MIFRGRRLVILPDIAKKFDPQSITDELGVEHALCKVGTLEDGSVEYVAEPPLTIPVQASLPMLELDVDQLRHEELYPVSGNVDYDPVTDVSVVPIPNPNKRGRRG